MKTGKSKQTVMLPICCHYLNLGITWMGSIQVQYVWYFLRLHEWTTKKRTSFHFVLRCLKSETTVDTKFVKKPKSRYRRKASNASSSMSMCNHMECNYYTNIPSLLLPDKESEWDVVSSRTDEEDSWSAAAAAVIEKLIKKLTQKVDLSRFWLNKPPKYNQLWKN